MDKKELILVTAKELLIAAMGGKPTNAQALAASFESLVQRVEAASMGITLDQRAK